MNKIVVLPGDGIGPEVAKAAQRVLEVVGPRHELRLEFSEELIGGAAIDATGEPLPQATLDACRASKAVLLGAVGGPKWDDPKAKVRPEQGLLGIRKALGLFANLRPIIIDAALADASPLKADRLAGVDFIVVRELTGGLYFGTPRKRETVDGVEHAIDTLEYTAPEIDRVVRLAFELSKSRRGLVTSVDKANVLESSRLWRDVATAVGKDFPGLRLEHQLVDSCAMRLIANAASFDVIVTENMFGDILTDEAAMLAGSLGLMPSASLGQGTLGLYEPIHGSAPDIAGKNYANPIGTIRAAAMLLRHSLGAEKAADSVERACSQALAAGHRTRDLGGTLSTTAMTDAVISAL